MQFRKKFAFTSFDVFIVFFKLEISPKKINRVVILITFLQNKLEVSCAVEKVNGSKKING